MEPIELIQSLSSPMTISPTSEAPQLEHLPGIKAVIFDVYGTLFLSGSGEISVGEGEQKDQAMMQVLQEEGIVTSPSMELGKGFEQLILRDHAQAIEDGVAFPEVEIREIWKRLLDQSCITLDDRVVERLVIRYECAVNPIWPMPGCEQIILTLRDYGLKMGIISNAQFYTPSLFEALLGLTLKELGLRDEYCVWSYQEREAKPSKALFIRMASALALDGIKVSEAVYVGNDMRNDIATAQAVGFRTALFAGDLRSLKWREEDKLDVTPDIVLTDLLQLLDCVMADEAE